MDHGERWRRTSVGGAIRALYGRHTGAVSWEFRGSLGAMRLVFVGEGVFLANMGMIEARSVRGCGGVRHWRVNGAFPCL
jgi:hypothetical protein